MAALPPAAHEAVAAAFRGAFDWVYLAAAVTAGIGFLAAAMLRPVLLAPSIPVEQPQAEMAEAATRAG